MLSKKPPIKERISAAAKSIFATFTDKGQSIECMAKQHYYSKLLIAWVAVFAFSLLSIIVARQFATLFLVFAMAIICFLVMAYCENAFATGQYSVVIGQCYDKIAKGEEKFGTQVRMRVAPGQVQWRYYFDGYLVADANNPEENFLFTLKGNNKMGFVVGQDYYFVIRGNHSSDVTDMNIITYNPITLMSEEPGQAGVADEPSQNERMQGIEALKQKMNER